MNVRLTERERVIVDAARKTVGAEYEKKRDALAAPASPESLDTLKVDEETDVMDACFLTGRRSGFRLGVLIIGALVCDEEADRLIATLQEHD